MLHIKIFKKGFCSLLKKLNTNHAYLEGGWWERSSSTRLFHSDGGGGGNHSEQSVSVAT